MLWIRDATKAAGSFQLAVSKDAGAETAIHATRDTFADVDADSVLLIDTENSFNSVNRKVMLHNLKFMCPINIIYATNCYATASRLFTARWGEILSREGAT